MKLLIADKFSPSGMERLQALDCAITYDPQLNPDTLPAHIQDHAVLIVRSTQVTATTIEAGKSLQLIVRAGSGTNTIDVTSASARGIYVANCPGKNAIAVAELAVGLMIALDRRIPQAHAELKQSQWNKAAHGKADGLFGQRLGILGLGQIGRELLPRARALGLKVRAWSRSLTHEEAEALNITRAESPIALAAQSDIVSMHLAAAKDTIGLVSQTFFEALPERAMVINTSRGGIVDEAALLSAMRERGIRYATDVFDAEPSGGKANFTNALAQHADVVCTPHIGASTEQAESAVAQETVRIVESFLTTGAVPNCVNLCAHGGRWLLNVRHLNRVGVLAAVLGSIRAVNLNVEHLENIIFAGDQAACARIQLGEQPSDALLQTLRHAEHVIDVQLVEA